jgi:hypothetical protein
MSCSEGAEMARPQVSASKSEVHDQHFPLLTE